MRGIAIIINKCCRHPFERLLSAYRDKFFPNGDAKYVEAINLNTFSWQV